MINLQIHKTIKMSYTEEDVMKMRLLVDGDGTGDDRRLNLLLKTFSNLMNLVSLISSV